MNLLDYRKDKYSFTGNDGIIEKIMQVLKIWRGFFVEFGAIDGIRGSNCRKLFDEGWDGFFIEGNEKRFKQLKNNYKDQKRIVIANAFINSDKNSENHFDNICDRFIRRQHINFCSIDVDGLDVEIFESIEKYLPTVVCIEGGQMLPPFHPRVSADIASNNIQQSLSVINEIFESKGYKLLCSYQDSFFIKGELFYLFDVFEKLLDHYFYGLLVHYRRLPFIQLKLKEKGLKNHIVENILEKSNFKKYRYINRKKWAIKQQYKIKEAIVEEWTKENAN